MWGYSTTSYPSADDTPSVALTVASAANSPGAAPGFGATANVTVTSSSSRVNATGADDAGVARQPSGTRSAAVPVTEPFRLFVTVTWTDRDAAVPAGRTAMSGATRTAKG